MKRVFYLTFLISLFLFALLTDLSIFAERNNFEVVGNLTPTIKLETGDKIPAPTEELKVGEKVEPSPTELKVVEKIPPPSPALTIIPTKGDPQLTLTPIESVPITIPPTVTGPIPITQYPFRAGPVSIEPSPAITGPISTEPPLVTISPVPVETNQINNSNLETLGSRHVQTLTNNFRVIIRRLRAIFSRLLPFNR